ncbi:uncharacterized protein LOC113202491 [Frankliniella occidentalis]|uniref:Uncharacterized protein LOC113202491 n=1 Tax=Frankliniella occidentalis TaxID=133901 RepID=A0A9C6X5Q7_FRAOC|nr:uncharacterized protein LOC113202491 [Frankliniella occidentalis]
MLWWLSPVFSVAAAAACGVGKDTWARWARGFKVSKDQGCQTVKLARHSFSTAPLLERAARGAAVANARPVMPTAGGRPSTASLALQTLLLVSPVLAEAARGLLAAAQQSDTAVPGWAGCVLAVLSRYPALLSSVWCESATACLPGATLANTSTSSSWCTSWTLGLTPDQGNQGPSSLRPGAIHVLVHDDQPADLWWRVRGRRLHVWLGAPAAGLAYLSALWRRAQLSDALLLLPGARPRDPVRIFSVYPYATECDSDAAVLVDEWVPDASGDHGGAFRLGRDLFPRKLHDLRGCNLTVFAREDSPFMLLTKDPITGETVLGGQLRPVLSAVEQHLNFRAVLRTPVDNETACDSRLATHLRHADLAFTMSVHGVDADAVRYDDSKLVVCLTWCVPVVEVRAVALQELLTPAAWLSVAVACVAAGLALAVVQRVGVDSLGGVWGACGLVCGPLLQQPAPLHPRGSTLRVHSDAMRALVAHWGFAALVLVAVLEGSVKSASVTMRSEPVVRSVHDLVHGAGARLALLGSVGVVDVVRLSATHSVATSDEDMLLNGELSKRLRVCDSLLDDALNRVADVGDAAVLTFDIRCTNYNHARGQTHLHLFEDFCMRPSPLHLFSAPRWSPYIDPVSEVRVRLGEAGLVTHRLMHKQRQPHGQVRGHAHGFGHAAMAQWTTTPLSDVLPCFLLLATGLVLAAASMAVELAYASRAQAQACVSECRLGLGDGGRKGFRGLEDSPPD